MLRKSAFIKRLQRALLISLLLTVLVGCTDFTLPFFSPQPTPTLEPVLLPPVVTEFTPRPGAELPLEGATLFLRFDQDMNRASVEAALRILPPLEGTFTWQGQRAVTFIPTALMPGARYQVYLGGEARAVTGVALASELAFTFAGLSPLRATSVFPASGETGARIDAPVLIAFNRPMVPASCAGRPAGSLDCQELPLTFAPAAPGQGEWVNSAVYRFTPRNVWASAQTYVATLDARATALDGAKLEAPVTWNFTTNMPQIVTVVPPPNALDQPRDTQIRVMFSTPMDPDPSATAFALSGPDGEPVPGAITWEDGGARLVFTPAEPLLHGVQYQARMGERARALTSMPVAAPLSWAFITAAAPRPQSIIPVTGAQAVPLDEPVRFTLAGVFDAPDVLPYLVITPTVASEDMYARWDGPVISLAWPRAPRTEYCVALLPGLPDAYGNVMEDGLSGCFVTADLPPLLDTAVSHTPIIVDAALVPTLDIVARNVERADFVLATLSQEAFIRGRNLPGAVLREWEEQFVVEPNTLLAQSVPLTRRSELLPTGYYLFSWQTDNVARDYTPLAVVDRHLTLKLASEEALVWVTDLRSGTPISRTEVRLLDHQGVLVSAGTTSAEGVARIRIAPLETLWEPFVAVVGEPGRPGFGLALSSWDSGATPQNFGLSVDAGPYTSQQLYMMTDRSVYQAGQTIHFWGAQRTLAAQGYVLPTNSQLGVTVRDPAYQSVYTSQLTLSAAGTWGGLYTLPATAIPGSYTLEARLPAVSRVWQAPFEVLVAQPSDFIVTVLPDQAVYFAGDTLQALIVAESVSGLPLAQADLTWRLWALPFTDTPDTPEDWVWGNTASALELLTEGQAVTDTAGRWQLTLPVSAAVRVRWLLEVSVSDVRGLHAEGHATASVYPGRVQLGLQPRRWVAAINQRTEFKVLALDMAQQPLATQPLTLRFALREWQPSREGPDWFYTDTPISEVALTADADGVASAPFTPTRSGQYIVTAETQDVGRQIIRTQLEFWVGGAATVAAWPPAAVWLAPVADARSYRPGDTARVLLPTTFTPPFQVLMTVEQGGVLAVRQFVAEHSSPLVEIPITAAYAPNVYVSFVAVKGVDSAAQPELPPSVPAVRVGYVNLPVRANVPRLTVELASQLPENYHPGAPLTLTVRTAEIDGDPVSAAVSLLVLDKTAATLTPLNTPGIWDGFYGEQPLRVLTGDALLHAAGAAQVIVGRPTQAHPVTAPRAALAAPVYWNGALHTDATGMVQVVIPLPAHGVDWIAEARVITGETWVGEATLPVRGELPLAIHPLTPPFLIAGDRPELAALIRNNTAEPLTATVRLEAVGVTVFGATSQEIALPARSWSRVVWKVDVAETAGALVQLTFAADGGGYRAVAYPVRAYAATDGTLPIYRYELPQIISAVGRLTQAGSNLAVLMRPNNATTGKLTVRVEPSLAATLLNGADFVQAQAQDTTEGVVSRLLALTLTYHTLRDIGQPGAISDAELAAQVHVLLDHLYFTQNADGGWAWWTGSSDVQMSAYATYGLLLVRQAGFSVRQTELDAALDYLSAVLRASLQQTNGGLTRGHAFAFYVLTLARRTWPEGVATALYTARPVLGATGRVYLALALGSADAADPRVKALLETLRTEALLSAAGAHWHDDTVYDWATATRATALMVVLLARLAPDDPLLPQAVDWLMTRGSERWTTTQATAWTLVALSNYLKLEANVVGEYGWSVNLNHTPLLSATVKPDALTEGFETHWPLSELLSDQPNVLEVTRTEGPGALYYAARLTLHPLFSELQPESRGLTLYREYCVPTVAVPDTFAERLLREPCIPMTRLHPGDEVEVRLRLVVPVTRYYITLSDPWPAGFVGIDTLVAPPEFSGQQDPFEQRVLQSERALFFATHLAPGVYETVYRLRAVYPGDYRALPALAYETYFPEVWARTGGAALVIVP